MAWVREGVGVGLGVRWVDGWVGGLEGGWVAIYERCVWAWVREGGG